MNAQIEKTPVSDELKAIITTSLDLFLARANRLLDKDLETKLANNIAKANEYGKDKCSPFIVVKKAGGLDDPCTWLLASIPVADIKGFSLVLDHEENHEENKEIHRFYFAIGVDVNIRKGFYSLSCVKKLSKSSGSEVIYKVDTAGLEHQSIDFVLPNQQEVLA